MKSSANDATGSARKVTELIEVPSIDSPTAHPGKGAVAEEILLGALVFSREIDSHRCHRGEVEHDRCKITEPAHGSALLSAVPEQQIGTGMIQLWLPSS
ncbi:hypothetical protein [Victivallis vadensis]|uniref:hypothetical protein n=1 Tax=Victivallis vadensis TaxID=172901 RepID=UPI00015725D0|nr:hypothetical protein [Victivallis vadensis]